MKKILLIVVVLCSFGTIQAQQRLADQYAIQVKGGYVTKNGYNVGVGLERYFGFSPNSIRFDFLYSDVQAHEEIKAKDYLANVSYCYSFDKIRGLYINVLLGGVLGGETLKIGNPLLVVKKQDQFKYGFSVGAEIEIPIFQSFSFVLSPYYINILNSDLNRNNFSINGGLKLYL